MLTTVRLYMTVDNTKRVAWHVPQLAMVAHADQGLETMEKVANWIGPTMMHRKGVANGDYNVLVSPTMINDVPFDDWQAIPGQIVAGFTVFVEWGVTNRDVENTAYEQLREIAATFG